jgi:hypothetical protein
MLYQGCKLSKTAGGFVRGSEKGISIEVLQKKEVRKKFLILFNVLL